MVKQHYISIRTVCANYDISVDLIESFEKMGLVEIHFVQEDQCILEEELSRLERMIRLHTELNINPEGIDVIVNLLEKERMLRDELIQLRNRLRRYENETGF